MLEFSWVSRLQHTSEGVDVALDLPHELPPPPLMWQWSGHPILPRTHSESDALIQLYKIASDLSFGKAGFIVESQMRPTIFELISSALDHEINENPSNEENDREKDRMEVIMASLLCDTDLRRCGSLRV